MAKIKNIDNFDLKIIDCMIFNSRIPLKELSKKIGRSKAFVKFRLESLLKNEIIEKIYPVIDVTSLGFIPFDVFIKIRMNKNEEESFIQSLKREYKIYYIERLVGDFSLRFSFFEKSYLSALDFIDILFQDYTKKISEVRICPIVKLIKSNKSINCGVKKTFMEFFNHMRQYKLGKKAKEVLKELNKNPRHSILEISGKLGFSRDFIKKTIANMEKEKLIVGYSIEIDSTRLGNISKFIAIELNLVNKQRLKEIINYLSYEMGVQTVSLYFPRNFIAAEMIIKTNTEFRDFQIMFMDKFKDDIAKLEVFDYYDEPKYSYMDEFLENAI